MDWPIASGLAGRLSFQVRKRDGYNQDIAHNIDLDDVSRIVEPTGPRVATTIWPLARRITGFGDNAEDWSQAKSGAAPGAVPLRIEQLRDLFHPKRTRTLMPFGIQSEDQAHEFRPDRIDAEPLLDL